MVEHQRLEIKGWCRDERELAEKAIEAASCLANASGGFVIIGVDEGLPRFSSCPFRNVNSAWIERRIKDHTLPPVECEVQDLSELLNDVRGVNGLNAFGIWVPRTRFLSAHHTTKGISKIRVGKECKPYFTAADDDRTGCIAPNVSTDDLSLTSITWAMGRHRTAFKVGSPPDALEFLAQARLIEPYLRDTARVPEYRVTAAALILFGKEAVIQRELPFFETVVITPAGTVTMRKNVVESMRDLVFSERSSSAGLCRDLPQDTVQELLINAYIHRCWRTPAPVMVRMSSMEIEIENPGDLIGGIGVGNLIHCIPAYRNFLLAEGARFAGLCDKIGRGIDVIFKNTLSGGLDFPRFESADNRFAARISLGRSEEFREFVKRRSASLDSIDEILTLRLLWDRDEVSADEIGSVLGRDAEFTGRVLKEMHKKLMIDPAASAASFRLSPAIRLDIKHVFSEEQMDLDLFGG